MEMKHPDLIAAFLDMLIARSKSWDLLSWARESGISEELGDCINMLQKLHLVLDKAEELQGTTSFFLRLRDLIYDVDDLLDELSYQAMGRIESESATGCTVGKLNLFSVAETGFGSVVKFNNLMVSEMKTISERLKNTVELIEFSKFDTHGIDILVKNDITHASPLLDESQVYGREDQFKTILDHLKFETGDGRTGVIPIVGMGGVGKTTLARMVYERDFPLFDLRAWVSVGVDFDVFAVTREILSQVGGSGPENLNSLQVKLKERILGKKFLIVLDDVWVTEKDYNDWKLFCSPFVEETWRSRILITTRSIRTSLITSATDGYLLQGLSTDDCLTILAYHALGRKDFNEHRHLKEVAEKIAMECKGLPLAAKFLGESLRGIPVRVWEELLNRRLSSMKVSIHQALLSSYEQLPSHLKRCFAYTAIFPTGFEFAKTDLVSLWMAEGFVLRMSEGYKNFDDLFERLFFQKSTSNESVFVMHDFVRDLAISVSGTVCLNLDDDEKAEKLFAEVRHLAFSCCEYEVSSRFEGLEKMKRLRTFLALQYGRQSYKDCYLSRRVLDVIIPKLKRLRVLALPYAIIELPSSIASLKHLRLLNLSYAKLEVLPESLCQLCNLQSLILFRCRYLRKLPRDFDNLINLEYLDIRDTNSLEKMPRHIGNLKKLHILGKFIVGNGDGCGIVELAKVPNLQGQLHIMRLQNVTNIPDAERVKMSHREGIDELKLEWIWNFDNSCNGSNGLQVLRALKPHTNIRKLSILSYACKTFPSWVGDPSFGNLVCLELCNCRNLESLPPLGQLSSLEELTLRAMNGIKEVGMEFYGEVPPSGNVFPSLKILRIEFMEELSQWSHYSVSEGCVQEFPGLKELDLKNCPKLVGNLPNHLPTLKLLYISSCPLLEVLPQMLPSLDGLVVEKCKEMVFRGMSNLQSLKKLEIRWITGLVNLSDAFLEALVSLKEMHVSHCYELEYLWDDGINVETLGCLKILIISGCCNVEKLPSQLYKLASLTNLRLSGCPKLETFPPRGLPYSVKHVEIEDCRSLTKLPDGIIGYDDNNSYSRCLAQIEELTIRSCEALILPRNVDFPSSLSYLALENFPKLKVFASKGLPLYNLLHLKLHGCQKLLSLPNHMYDLTSLQSLDMKDCPEVDSLPKGGLPRNLKRLLVSYCDKLERKLIFYPGLAFICLQELSIEVKGGLCDVKSFPDDSPLFSASLSSLRISGLKNLKFLTSTSDGLRGLTSLQILSIAECPKLQSLPKGGLPPSLGRLEIVKCPLLEKRCSKGGVLWPLVSSVPLLVLESGYCQSSKRGTSQI